MAEYIKADRWLTGVATHKTKSGRILCTGVGCVGCFPEDYPKLALELEVYDSKTSLVFGESWNDLSNEESLETGVAHSGSNERGQYNIFRENIERGTESKETSDQDEKRSESVNNNGISAPGESGEIRTLFLTEYTQQTETRAGDEDSRSEGIESCKYSNTADRGAGVSTKDPIVTDASLSSILRGGGLEEIVCREDCVCLFFSLESCRGARMLPDFTILEIVDSLTALMRINEIKCVQRMNGMWHVVLRTRKHLGHLLQNGLRIRGRWFQMIQNNDMYCDKVDPQVDHSKSYSKYN